MRRLRKFSIFGAVLIGVSAPAVFAALPSTTTYKLNSFGFGSGGTANSTTTNYALEGITGEVDGQNASTTLYTTKPGFIETQQADVPKITISNPSNYYDKLHFVIDTQGNPTDALYAIQISTDNFVSNFNYVKLGDTIGSTLTLSDYQTSAAWSAGSANIIGLAPNTTYYLRAKATQGKYTESGYGPSTNAATVGQQLSLCIYSSPTCSTTTSEAMGALLPGVVSNSPSNIGVDFATNADSGGNVYIYSTNGGLLSTSAGHTITSATANLTSGEGFGAQVASVTQSSGGPLAKVSPYDLSGNNVGILSTNVNTIFTTTNNPIVGGVGKIQLQALASNITPAAQDYSETLTIIAAAAF